MEILLCLDDRDGLSFGGRRQSQDRLLRARLLAGGPLRMSAYSARQFEPDSRILAGDDFLRLAAPGDRCFVETDDLAPWEPDIERLTVYRWHRAYPFDTRYVPADRGWRLAASADFPGYSHEIITEEIYTR